MNHILIYYKQGTGNYVVTDPRRWARENTQLFPNYNFINREPRTAAIEKYLMSNFDLQRISYPQRNLTVLFPRNLDPTFVI